MRGGRQPWPRRPASGKVLLSFGRRGPALRENPHRQSRRDRRPRHPRLPRDGHPDRRGLLRGRPRVAPRADGRRGRLLGPPPAAESYLSIDRIIAAARDRGAEAVHPGYGFLAENAAFAEACAAAGLVFIGPPPAGHPLHGRQDRRRKRGHPDERPGGAGHGGAVADEAEAARRAGEIGFPSCSRRRAGGGGKGMRLVRAAGELAAALRAARSEAAAAFGDGSVYLERYVEEPRHIEVQVLADAHGTRGAPGRARVLDPAPPPEAHRGEPLVRSWTPDLRAAHGRGRRAGSRRRRLRQRGDGGVPRRRRAGTSTSSR